MLDYLSDFISCLYGVPGTYGVVTAPFGVREGINIFLDVESARRFTLDHFIVVCSIRWSWLTVPVRFRAFLTEIMWVS